MTPEELYAMEAETGRTSEWEPLYRAEKARADAVEAAVARVRAMHWEMAGPLSGRPGCVVCGIGAWPCSTVAALDTP